MGQRNYRHSTLALGHLCHLSNSSGDLCFLHHHYFTTIITVKIAICHCKARNSDFLRTQGGSGPKAITPCLMGSTTQSKEVQGSPSQLQPGPSYLS